MKTIALLSQKGGSGKTTVAVHLAVAAEQAKERVVLIDTDPQQSATVWGTARESLTPIVATAAVGDLEKVLDAAQVEHMSLCIVDTTPHAAPEAACVAKSVDLIVIPCRPTAFDIAAVSSAVEIARAAKVRAVIVLSACPFRAPEIRETREVLAAYGLPIFQSEITERRAFARAIATGRAVTEFEAEGKAATEIRALWRWIKKEQLR